MTNYRIPEYADMSFEGLKNINSWLKEHVAFVVLVRSWKIDVTMVLLAKTGEIIYTDSHIEKWRGNFVDLDRLKVGQRMYAAPGWSKVWGQPTSLIPQEIHAMEVLCKRQTA